MCRRSSSQSLWPRTFTLYLLSTTINLGGFCFSALWNLFLTVSVAANLVSSTIASPWSYLNIFLTLVPAFVLPPSLWLQSFLNAPGRVIYFCTNLDHVTPQLNSPHHAQWLFSSQSPHGHWWKWNWEHHSFCFHEEQCFLTPWKLGVLLEAKEEKLCSGYRSLHGIFKRRLLCQSQRKQIVLPPLGLMGRGWSQKGGCQLRFRNENCSKGVFGGIFLEAEIYWRLDEQDKQNNVKEKKGWIVQFLHV